MLSNWDNSVVTQLTIEHSPERVLYVVNNVTERLSVRVAATSAILLLNASKLLAIVGNGTHPMLSAAISSKLL